VLGIAVPTRTSTPSSSRTNPYSSVELAWPSWMRFSSRPAGPGSTNRVVANHPRGWEKVAQVFVAETGADMSRDTAVAHLAAWTGLVSAMNESAGKQSPAGKRHGNKWLTAMLVEAAGSVGRMHGKNYLAVKHARLTRRRGIGPCPGRVATRSWLPHWMLTRDEPYHDFGPDWHERCTNEAHTRRLIAQLEHLGRACIEVIISVMAALLLFWLALILALVIRRPRGPVLQEALRLLPDLLRLL
jgi:hypothetical protein